LACRGRPACRSRAWNCLGEQRYLRRERRRLRTAGRRAAWDKAPELEANNNISKLASSLASPHSQARGGGGQERFHNEECRVWHAKLYACGRNVHFRKFYREHLFF